MEYLFRDCLVKIYCSYCSTRNCTSPEPIKRIPQPVSDPDNPLHYKSVDVTHTQNPINAKPREPDDFQPRTNIRNQWDDGLLPTKQEIQSFCQEFAVEPDLVKSYILHLQDLRIQADIMMFAVPKTVMPKVPLLHIASKCK